MPPDALLRWFIVLYLASIAVVRIGFRRQLGNATSAVQRFWCSDDPLGERLSAALARRLRAGDSSDRACIITGSAALVLAGTCAWTPLAASLAYAFDCTIVVAVMWMNGKTIRADGPRSAPLSNRRAMPTIPYALLAVAAIAALSLVAFGLRQTTDALAVLAVIVAVGLSVGCAASLAASPTYLPGEDLDAEMIVDRRLRFFRAGSAFITAVAPLFVFASFSGYSLSTARFASWLLCAAVTIVIIGWFFVTCKRLELSSTERIALSR